MKTSSKLCEFLQTHLCSLFCVTAAAFVQLLCLHLPQIFKMAWLLHRSTYPQRFALIGFLPNTAHKKSTYDWISSPFVPPIYFRLIFIR